MVTGDVTTGLPFFLNTVDYDPNWIRVWLPTTTSVDKEVLALDIAFPSTGHDFEKPVYLVLHGLNGGSAEGYVKDLVMRRNLQGSTVVVMIARGMMGKYGTVLVYLASGELFVLGLGNLISTSRFVSLQIHLYERGISFMVPGLVMSTTPQGQ